MATKNRIDLHFQPGDALLIVDVPHDFLPCGPTLPGLPLFGLTGYLGAAAGGVWLLLSILKSRNADRE